MLVLSTNIDWGWRDSRMLGASGARGAIRVTFVCRAEVGVRKCGVLDLMASVCQGIRLKKGLACEVRSGTGCSDSRCHT